MTSKSSFFVGLLALVVSLSAGACAGDLGTPRAGAPIPTSLTGLTIIDGNGGPPRTNQTIVIRSGRITDIFPTSSRHLPAGGTVVDMTGRFAIPGLIDTHVHIESQQRDQDVVEGMLRNALLGGVTSVRDMGGNGAKLQELSRRSAASLLPSPSIFYGSLIIGRYSDFWMKDEKGRFVANGSAPGSSAWFRQIDDSTDLVNVVRDAKRYGAAGLKVHSGVPAGLLMRLVAEARRQGMPVWSHAAINPARPSDAVRAGVSALSHADMLAFEGLPTEEAMLDLADYRVRALHALQSTPPDSVTITNLLIEMKRRGVILEPTLFIINYARSRAAEADRARLEAHASYAAAITKRANALGVEVVAGTDSLIRGRTPIIHSELQFLVAEGGLTPLEAITAATKTAARLLGIGNDRGTIAIGKSADIVILAADPSQDIRNSLTVITVFKAGKRYDRDAPLSPPPLSHGVPSRP